MIRSLLSLFVFAALTASASADVITRWNFNSNPSDANVTTGTNVPSFGTGTLTLQGNVTSTYATGAASDPASSGNDNSGINLARFPFQFTGNLTGGARFDVSTEGFTGIAVSWSQRLSATASRYTRFQYTLNGVDFVNGPVILIPVDSVFTNLVIDLSSVADANNNASFGFRLVSEFEDTATGGGAAGYLSASAGTTNAYSTNGTLRLDMVTVSGTGTGGAAPTITALTNQTIRANTSTPAQPFTVGDAETPVNLLIVQGSSANPGLIPDANIAFGGTNPDRDISVTPLPDQSGSALITVTVLDTGGRSNTASYVVTVRPTNTPPVVSPIGPQFTARNVPTGPIAFTVSDEETPASDLTVTATSGNLAVLPELGIEVNGLSTNRTLVLTPAPDAIGRAKVTVAVSDGTLTTTRTFILSVTPSGGILLYEPFDYVDGPLTTVSDEFWSAHSGVSNGPVSVVSQTAFVTSSGAEDVNAPLANAPYTIAGGSNLYASFKCSFSALPNIFGDYFAHFRDAGTGFRCRLYAATTNAPFGSFRLGIANAANATAFSNVVMAPVDLAFDTTNVVVLLYNVGTGESTLWINPTSAASEHYTATDTGSLVPISTFAFRQSAGIGDIYVDDLRVALTFNEALGLPSNDYTLSIRTLNDGSVVVSWPSAATAAGFGLQWTPAIPSAEWTSLTPTGTEGSFDIYTLGAPQPSNTGFFRLYQP